MKQKNIEYPITEWQKKALGTIEDGWKLISINQSTQDTKVTETWQK